MAHQQSGSSTNILAIIVVAVLAFAGGFLVKGLSSGPSSDKASADAKEGAAAKASDGKMNDSDKLPVGDSPVRGPEDALVTVVAFSDFQCPYCSKGEDRLKQLREKHPKEVRIVYKHYPLPFHNKAKPAARAAMAAGEQGKFWEMHDKLFANQGQLRGADVKKLTTPWAKEMGLDVEKFKKDFDKEEYAQTIKEDMQLGKKNGVKGTPYFIINGTGFSGAQPYSKFESTFQAKLKEAKKWMEGGTARADIYKKAIAENMGDSPSPSQADKKPKRRKSKVSMVEVNENDAVAGAKEDYLVTLVEFSDFECPFCNKVVPTINKIKENYGDQVRVVFKHRPLPMHSNAKSAAKAAIAAQKQGKFWEFHDKLFANHRKLGESFYEKAAKELGLNLAKFNEDRKSDAAEQQLQSDMAQAGKVGARGTPTLFVNGIKVVGAQPYSRFSSIIDKQIEKAKELKEEKGLSGEELYEALVEVNKEEQGGGGQPGGNKPKPQPKADMSALEIGPSPAKGPADAPVTIYEFSDFECPFCSKAHKTLQSVLKDYKGKVKLVHKHYPLPMHSEAKPAAYASIAAQKQDKFWEMYDALFNNQNKLQQDGIYVKLARQIGLNVSKFKKDMEAAKSSNRIQQDMAMGQKVGVRGTPHFIINGQKLSGAQPAGRFKSAIDNALN